MSKNSFKDFFKSVIDAENALDAKTYEDHLNEELKVISTGSPKLDDALGCGGIPTGRVVQFYGPGGSGKTLMALLTMKKAQELDPEAEQLFIDAEQTFSFEWAEKLGLDTNRINVVDGETAVLGRNLFTFLCGVPKEDAKKAYAGKKVEGLLDKVAKKELNINLIVIDSLGVLIPPQEDTAEIGKANIALLARFLSTTMKKVVLATAKADIPLIVINHVKASMEMYGSDHSFSGGNSWNHSLSANIYFEQVGRKDAQVLDEKEKKIGATIRAAVEKSKFGSTGKVEFQVDFSKGVINLHQEVCDLALDYDIATKPNNQTYEYGDQKWRGADNFYTAVAEDENLFNELLSKVRIARDNRRKGIKNTDVVATVVSEEVDALDILAKSKKKKAKE